jgi:hypothetical protein
MAKDLPTIRKQVSDINRNRMGLITKVLNTKPFIAAQVYERYKKCGNKRCKCQKGELHGPFLWIYQRKKDQKIISTTVVKDKAIEAKKLAWRYENLQRLRKEIREADRVINILLNELETQLEMEIGEYVKRKKTT